MKRIVAILAFLTLLLTACGGTAVPKPDAYSAPRPEGVALPAVEQANGLRSPDDGVFIYDDEFVAISFLGCGTRHDDQVLVFYVVNKTTATLTFQASSMAIDGESLGFISGSDAVAPESSGKIRYSTEEPFPTMQPKTISGEIRIVDFSEEIFERSYNVTFSNVETP